MITISNELYSDVLYGHSGLQVLSTSDLVVVDDDDDDDDDEGQDLLRSQTRRLARWDSEIRKVTEREN